MNKLLTFLLTALLTFSVGWAATVTDVLTRATTGVTGTSYTEWSGKTVTSTAIYAGQSAGGNSSIQLRSDKSNSGVITTASGGKVKSITVEWYSSTSNGRTLNVYGKNAAYSAATELYDASNQGTLLGTIVKGTSTSLTISGDYEYIGFRSASGAMYLTSVTIEWDTEGGTTPTEPKLYRKVTSLDDLVTGKKVIFMHENGASSVGMGAIESNNHYGTPITGLSIEDNKVDIAGKNVTEFTLGTYNGNWTFLNPDNRYLGVYNSTTGFGSSGSLGYSDLLWTIEANGRVKNNSKSDYIRVNTSNYFGLHTNATLPYAYLYIEDDGTTPVGDENIYKKVTSLDDLVAGKTYIIVNEANGVGMGAVTLFSSTYAGSVVNDLTFSNNQVNIAGTDVVELTLSGDAQGGWSFVYDGNYLNWSSGNSLSTASTVSNSSKWTVSSKIVGGANGFALTNVEAPARTLLYNSGSPRFACYESSQSLACLYVKDSNDPTLTVTPTSLALADIPYDAAAGTSTSDTFHVTGAHLTGDVTIACSDADFTVSPTTLSPVDGSVSQDITVSYSGTSTSEVTGTVTITCGELTRTVTVTAKKQTPPPAVITVAPATLNINDSSTDNALTITGQYVNGNINASLANNADWYLNPTTFSNTGGTASVTYTGRALSASNTVTAQAANDNTVSAQATVNYQADLYIVTDNGVTNQWDFTNGIHMTYSDGMYTGEFEANQANTFILFARKLGNDVTWNTRLVFGPDSNGDWLLPASGNGTGTIDLNDDDPIKIQYPGLYTITIDANTGALTITSILRTVETPTFSPAPGTYPEPQTVTISCATAGATISYSLDGGTTWTVGNTVNVSETTTILAKATKEGMYDSETAEATYTIRIPGEGDFVLVTSIDDLSEGDEIIIVNSGTDGTAQAMAGQRDNNRDITDVEVTALTVADNYPDMQVILLEGDNTDGWYFNVGSESNAYLYAASSGSNHLKTRADKGTDGNAKATIEIAADGNATIKFQGNYTRNWLRYNTNSSIFSCYASGQGNVYIYKRSAAKVSSPVITPAGGTANKKFDDVEVTMSAAEGCTIYYTLDGSVPTQDSEAYDDNNRPVVAYGTAPVTVKAIAVDSEGNVSKVTTVVYYWDKVTVSITPASGRYAGDVENVTITPTPSDATVTYKVSNGAAQSYTGPFTVTLNETNHEVKVVAIATYGKSTATDTVTYTFKSDKVYSIAEFLALDEGEEVTFESPVTVLFDYSQNSSTGQEYIWVKDRTGYTQFFISPQFKDGFIPKYENGDVIPAGFKVKKGYYDGGGYIQAQCDEWHETFQDAQTKALADPEQVLLSDLLANPGEYNNRYLYINKLQVSQVSGLNFRIATDENGDGVAEVQGGSDVVGYNKYNSPAWKNKQGDVVGVTLPTDDKFYNVTFIFQQWQGGYEIMPIQFTEWVDNSVRLEDLVKTGVEGDPYTISNPLIAACVTWDDSKGKFAIFAKDDEMFANKRKPASGQKSYMIDYESEDGKIVNTTAQEDYDQSNWIEILIPNESGITNKTSDPDAYLRELDELKAMYENKILPGGSIKDGIYIDAFNPTIEVSLAPVPDANSTYQPNIYCTGNFLMENLDADGATSYRGDEYGGQFFMMDAKPQEFCMVVWTYFIGNDNYFVAPAREGTIINGYQFHGSFLADMSLCREVRVGMGSPVSAGFAPSNDKTPETLYGFNAIVRKNPASSVWQATGGNGAPRRIQPYADGKEAVPAYIVYPLNSQESSNGNVTGIEEMNGAEQQVESVRYFNVMGMESDRPFEGVNIVVTRYTDGTTSSAKVLK